MLPLKRRALLATGASAVAAGAARGAWWFLGPHVVGFGDSLTFYDGVSYMSHLPWHYRKTNLGIPGEQTTVGLPRLRAWLDQHSADVVIVLMGTNDAYFQSAEEYSAAAVVQRQAEMLHWIRQGGAKPILATPIPIIDEEHGRANDRLRELAPKLDELAQLADVPFVDLYREFVERGDDANLYQSDGVHPTDSEGVALIASLIGPLVRRVLRST